MSLNVPINCAYRFALPNSMVVLSPYLGINLKGNVIGTSDLATDTQEWFDNDFKRFQFGWHIGAGMEYKKLYVGLSYGTDFIKITPNVNTGTFKHSIGLNF